MSQKYHIVTYGCQMNEADSEEMFLHLSARGAVRTDKLEEADAVLINTARGGIVNEADLFEALSANIIRAAYFDVLVNEPPKEDEPLLSLPNFYLTPHIASRSKEAEKNTADMATQIMIDALKKRN